MNKYLLLSLFLFLGIHLHAQDPIFSQFHRTNVYLNPASTGMTGGVSWTVAAREQWNGITGKFAPSTFSTQYTSFEMTSRSYKHGVSAYFTNDIEGDASLHTTSAGLNYAYVIPVILANTHHYFRIGFGPYFSQKSIDWDKLLFSDQLHPKGTNYFLPQSSHAQYFDRFRDNPPWWVSVNFGLMYSFHEKKTALRGKEFDVGLSITHPINQINPASIESLQSIGTGIAPRMTLHGSAFFPLLRFGVGKNHINPIFHGRIEYQGGISAATIGMDFQYRKFEMGGYYQNSFSNTFSGSMDALVLTFNMRRIGTSPFDLGLSYDINLSGLRSYTGGVFEVVLKTNISELFEKDSKPMPCPFENVSNRVFYENPDNKNLN